MSDSPRRRASSIASKIFSWFSGDFERDAGSVKDYLTRFATEADHALIEKARLEFLSYDWDLNDVPRE